jgi:hypothetical protein
MSNTEKGIAVLQNSGNLPAFMKDVDAKAMNRAAAKGTSTGDSPNRISIKQSRFRLIVGGVQVKVFENSFIDVIMVRANPEASKSFFSGNYDPSAEDQMPDCWSDNGIHPSPNVENKVSRWCKNCPKNAWGSAISKISGKKIKACDDRKRIAVVPESRPDGAMYQVSIPGASLTEFAQYLSMLDEVVPAVPYNGVVTRISFDPDADYPKLLFKPMRYITDEEYGHVGGRFDSEESRKVATISDITDPPPSDLASAPEVGGKVPAPAKAQDKKPEAEAEPELSPEQVAEAERAEAAEAAKTQALDDWGEPAVTEAAPKAKPRAKAKAKPEAQEPPAKQHEQAEPEVSTGKSAVDSVFEGWDD